MIHLLIGAAAVLALWFLVDTGRRRRSGPRWWQWLITGLGLGYAVFVLELIVGFLEEGAPRAALVMGLITGLIAVIWWILLGRLVFFQKKTE